MKKLKKKNRNTFIIAEIGPNHNGSFKRATHMIKELSKSEVDCVKFQLGDPHKIFSKNSFIADYQKKNDRRSNIIRIAKSHQLTKKEHLKLSKICKQNDLIYACTAFDLESLIFLDRAVKVPFFKIASGEVFSIDMLEYISKQKKPIFLSTGMSTFKDITEILKRLNKNFKKDITVMHCVSSYPAKKDILNINLLDKLREKFNCNIGYSDHSLGNDACLAAVSKGATVIEKHVTLSKRMRGPDHKASATINEISSLVKKINKLEVLLGKPIKKFSKDEINVFKAARKSIAALNNIPKNKIIKKRDLCFRRPGTGISPFNISEVIGKRAKIDIEKNILIRKDFFK